MKPMGDMTRRVARMLCVLLLGCAGATAHAAVTVPLIVSNATPGTLHAPNDFNGDGFSDLALFDAGSHQLSLWMMGTDSTGKVQVNGERDIAITPGYTVGAVGDLNGDGLADLVFTSAAHDLYLWTNNGQATFTSQSLGTYPAGWQLIGAGDVDGDGSDDLLWFDASTCQLGWWLMVHGQRTGSGTVGVDCDAHPVAIGYFTPTPRVSVTFMSDTGLLAVWDSGAGSYARRSLGRITGGDSLRGFGGGHAGLSIGLVVVPVPAQGQATVTVFLDGSSRYFNAQGRPVSFAEQSPVTSSLSASAGLAASLVRGGSKEVGQVYDMGSGALLVCTPTAIQDVSAVQQAHFDSDQCTSLVLPAGMSVLGSAPAGGY